MRATRFLHRDIIIQKILLCLVSLFAATHSTAIEIDSPVVLLTHVPAEISVTGVTPGAEVRLSLADRDFHASGDAAGTAVFTQVVADRRGRVAIAATVGGAVTVTTEMRVLPGRVSITPLLMAILIALTLRNVIPALLIGV